MTFNIVGKKSIWFSLSALAVGLSVAFLIIFGLKPGIDFTGGSLLEISFTGERPQLSEVQHIFENSDYGAVRVQPTGDKGYILKMRFISEQEHQDILDNLRETFEVLPEGSDQAGLEFTDVNGAALTGVSVEAVGVDSNTETDTAEDFEGDTTTSTEDMTTVTENRLLEERIETIGPAVSAHLKERSAKAAVAVIIAIVVYVAYAFRRVSKPVKSWKYGVTAVIALIHDVTITMGVFALLGHFRGVEVDIPFVVAMLTVMGYSVNDTIVVFDRVRENLIKYGYDDFKGVVNKGINETLVRSLNTSVTTLLVLFALYGFGGDSIHYFSLALIAGIAVGTYSSIFLASPLLIVWRKLGQK